MKVYDLCLAFTEEFFSLLIQEACAQARLSFFLIEPHWAQEFLQKLREGEVGVRVLIDMFSDAHAPDDFWYALAREAKASGGHVINDPDIVSQAAHKARFHHGLVERGVPVPPTVIVGRDQLGSFRLTEESRSLLGDPFVVKPGWGGGSQGVILDAHSEEDLHRSAREAPNSDSFLLQRRVDPRLLDGHKAWFRVFHVVGTVIPCWWEPPYNTYRVVSPLERQTYGLAPLVSLSQEIAALSRMEFFSTEIALTQEGKFVAVDYANDQCDMHPQSYYRAGVPDEVVRRIASLLVQKAVALTDKMPFDDEMARRDWDWDNRRRSGHLYPGE